MKFKQYLREEAIDQFCKIWADNIHKRLSESDLITKQDLDNLERWADTLFAKVGIDIEFTKHFIKRVNDTRNKKQITFRELTLLFRDTYKKHGKKIPKLGPDAEAVIKDIKTDINLPFVLVWDRKSQEFDLIAKTVMRKKDFKSAGLKLTVGDNRKK